MAMIGRTAVLGGGGMCTGARAGYAIALPGITLTPSLAACREHLANPFVATTLTEVSASMAATHAWDIGRIALSLGGRLGGSLLHEQFTTSGVAPPRSQAALRFALIGGAALRVVSGLEVVLDVDLASYLFRRADARGMVRWTAPLSLGAGAGFAYAW